MSLVREFSFFLAYYSWIIITFEFDTIFQMVTLITLTFDIRFSRFATVFKQWRIIDHLDRIKDPIPL